MSCHAMSRWVYCGHTDPYPSAGGRLVSLINLSVIGDCESTLPLLPLASILTTTGGGCLLIAVDCSTTADCYCARTRESRREKQPDAKRDTCRTRHRGVTIQLSIQGSKFFRNRQHNVSSMDTAVSASASASMADGDKCGSYEDDRAAITSLRCSSMPT